MSIETAKSRKPRLAVLIVLLTSSMIAGLVALSAYTVVPQVTRAPGSIVPIGAPTQIETMEGGIAGAVHVSEGQFVEAGQPLIQLTHPDLTREFAALSVELPAVQARLANAEAILSVLDSGSPPARSELDALEADGLNRAAATLSVYAESQRIGLVAIEQQEAAIRTLTEAAEFALLRAGRREESLEQSKSSYDQGLTTLRTYQAEQDQADALRATASDAAVRLAQARSVLTNAIADRQQRTLTLREEVLDQIDELEQQELQVRSSRDTVRHRLSNLNLTAPVSGIVQSVAFPNVGEVIEAGETIFELLPIQDRLVVEARIPIGDIGHIALEHPVSVSADAFDVRRYGKVEGRLGTLSPLSLIDEQTGQPYFRATIELDDLAVGEGTLRRPLQAGMSVVAEFTTDERTFLEYVLKPVASTLRDAFTER